MVEGENVGPAAAQEAGGRAFLGFLAADDDDVFGRAKVALERFERLRRDDDELGAGAFDQRLDLFAPEFDIQWHPDAPGYCGSVHTDDPRQAVVADDGDAVAFLVTEGD